MKTTEVRDALRSDGHRFEERTTHRLEAFSDIVIGFSLAQLGLTLVIPEHAIDFVMRPAGIFAFVVTFIVVVRFWWVNYLIFERYFRPNRAMIALNFVALASLILQVFSLQLYLHFVPLNEGSVSSRIYFGFFALSYGVQGVTLALGLRYRWSDLSTRVRRAGIRELLARFGIVAGSIVGNALATGHVSKVVVNVGGRTTLVANLPAEILVDTFIGAAAGVIASRFVRLDRRSDEREAAGSS